tara:strand:+ start:76 stop:324 length:249 start_codon:yes stop_codon:yes gene_type:complete
MNIQIWIWIQLILHINLNYGKNQEYVNLVNDELIDTQLMYSKSDIKEAVCYAFEGVVVSQTEVGSDIYSKLIYGKIKEYLNK